MHFGDWYVLYILVYSIHVFSAHVWFCWYVSLDVGFGINDLCKQRTYSVPLSCLYVERTFHGLFGMLICILFVLRPYKNVTIFQNGHLVPDPN